MSATKSAKKTAKAQAPKAKAKMKPVTGKTEPKIASKPRTKPKEQVQVTELEQVRIETFGNVPAKEPVKPAKAKKPAKEQAPKKLSAIDAAAKVLSKTGEAMNCVSLIEAMATKGYWTSPGGKTPHATLYTAVTMLPNLAP